MPLAQRRHSLCSHAQTPSVACATFHFSNGPLLPAPHARAPSLRRTVLHLRVSHAPNSLTTRTASLHHGCEGCSLPRHHRAFLHRPRQASCGSRRLLDLSRVLLNKIHPCRNLYSSVPEVRRVLLAGTALYSCTVQLYCTQDVTNRLKFGEALCGLQRLQTASCQSTSIAQTSGQVDTCPCGNFHAVMWSVLLTQPRQTVGDGLWPVFRHTSRSPKKSNGNVVKAEKQTNRHGANY